jgi:uncharacterized membrane protein YhhN
MLKRYFPILYILVLLVDLGAIALQEPGLRFISKPLLSILLLVDFLSVKASATFKVLMSAALTLCCMGDILLLFPDQFMAGLGSFLLAHICFIGFFLKIRYSNHPLPLCQWAFVFGLAAIIIGFLFWLEPIFPVLVYAVVIYIMVQSVMHAFRLKEQPYGWYSLLGACLFMLSDGLIAVTRFKAPFPGIDLFIMLTYGVALYGLVKGGKAYLRN